MVMSLECDICMYGITAYSSAFTIVCICVCVCTIQVCVCACTCVLSA